jgi:hypothetical protein
MSTPNSENTLSNNEDGEHGDLQVMSKEGNCTPGNSLQSGSEMEKDGESSGCDSLPKNPQFHASEDLDVNAEEGADLTKVVEDSLEDDLNFDTLTNINTSADFQVNQEEVRRSLEDIHIDADVNTSGDLQIKKNALLENPANLESTTTSRKTCLDCSTNKPLIVLGD